MSVQKHLDAAATGLPLQELRLRLVDVDLKLLLMVVILLEHALRDNRVPCQSAGPVINRAVTTAQLHSGSHTLALCPA